MKTKDTQDILAGLGMSAVGTFAAFYAQQYEFGGLRNMGPGFFPVVLGSMLAVLGLMIAVPAFFRHGEPVRVAWKTLVLVLGSIVVFALMLKVVGLVIATALAVIISTLADNETRWKGRLLVAAGVSLVTYLVFGLALGMVLPMWPWSV